jgi:DNA polymerase-3 subunit delta
MAGPRGTAQGFEQLRSGPLTTGEVGPVYVLVGADQLRLEASVQKMKSLVLDPATAAFSERILYGDQVEWQDVLQAAQSFSMFGGRQLVWLKKLEALDAKKDDKNLASKALIRYFADPAAGTVLILSGEKVDGRRGWVADARKRGYLYQFEAPTGRDLEDWIARAARREGLTLDAAGRRVLAELVGNDLRGLQAEITKLSLIEDSRGKPVAADELPGLVMDQAELEVFALSDQLVGGQVRDVLATWWRMRTWGSDPQGVTPLVAAHLRRVALAAAARSDGLAPADVTSWTGMNSWMYKNKLLPHADRLGPEGVGKLISACLECERTHKSRPIPPETALEQLLLTVAKMQEARPRD